jgi:hypothetical protein
MSAPLFMHPDMALAEGVIVWATRIAVLVAGLFVARALWGHHARQGEGKGGDTANERHR